MGRKQKLRQERRRQESATTTTTTSVVGVEATTPTAYTNANANANANVNAIDDVSSTSVAGTGALSTAATTCPITGLKLTHSDSKFPISGLYLQAMQLINKDDYYNVKAINDLCVRGAIEDGCINSMNGVSQYYLDPELDQYRIQKIYLAHPWSVEGAIRGSVGSISGLINKIHNEAKPYHPFVVSKYWKKMIYKYYKWNGDYSSATKNKLNWKVLRDEINKSCIVCGKEDTDTLTLKQCRGCSTVCYCGKECQTFDWEERNHRCECKQIQILNEYHKPYAKEIREAAIRGESHPALERLRNKLGLTRPTEEYF